MADSTTPEPIKAYELLSATYASPTNAAFTHTHQISTPPSSDPSERTAYLAALRKATSVIQEQINKDLTARMEEDKAREAAGTAQTHGGSGVDEEKEEDNYGEEVPEED